MSVGAVNKSTGDRIPTAGMPAIDDALDLTSVNPVQNAIITAALANKQDKTDNSLQTTDKTVVGAVNELKSGLTNYQAQNDFNLEVPNRKNLWDGNYTDIAPQTVTYKPIQVVDGNYTISTTCPQNSLNGANIFLLSGNVQEGASTSGNGAWEGHTKTVASANGYITIAYKMDGGVDPRNYDTQIEYGSTATAFAPYIPSVESRIEAVESGLTDMPMKQWQKNTSGSARNVTFTFSSSVNRYAGLLFCINNSGVSAIFAVAYKEDIEPTITRLAGSDAVTPSISIDGSITVGLYAWSTAILFANGNFV